LGPRNDEKSPEEAQKGAIFRGDCEPPTPAGGSRAGESAGRWGKIEGNPSFGTSGALPFGGAVLAFAALSFARDKRGIAVELKGKREDEEEILQKRVERERDGERIRAVRNLGGVRETEEREKRRVHC
jgi:hypothetical protein